MHPFRNAALVAGLSLAVASCADAQRTASPPTVSDSAGIRIVSNAWPTNAAATLAGTPSLEIGGGSDPAGDLAFVVDAVRLGGGRIAIAEQSTKSIKIFDARGRFVRAIGRQGGGPGEFSAITRLLLLRGDSIAAYDGLRGVLSVFDTTGKLGRTNRVMSEMGGLQLVGLLGNGTMIMTRGYNPVFARTSRLERDPITYVSTSPGSASVDTIMTVPGSDVFLFAGPDYSSRTPLPFGRVSLALVQDDRIIVAPGDRWQIEVRTPAGALREIHRVRRDPTQVTREDIARFKASEIERMRGSRPQATGGGGGGTDIAARMQAQRTKVLEAIPYPATFAPYDSLLAGDAKEVWVRAGGTPAGQPQSWVVLSPSGAATGTVTIPAGMRLLEVGRDYVIGVRTDEDDVERVGIFPLRRAASR